jgi:hypothetical protein
MIAPTPRRLPDASPDDPWHSGSNADADDPPDWAKDYPALHKLNMRWADFSDGVKVGRKIEQRNRRRRNLAAVVAVILIAAASALTGAVAF